MSLVLAVLLVTSPSHAQSELIDSIEMLDRRSGEFYALGRYDQAMPLVEEALALAERNFGENDSRTLDLVNKLGLLHNKLGAYVVAEKLYKRALNGREIVLGLEHRDTLINLNNLGTLYLTQGRLVDAEPILKRVLSTNERLFGKDHEDTLRSLNNLASVYADLHDYAKAEPLLKRALEDARRVLGPVHPGTLSALNNLADLYRELGRYRDAQTLNDEALTRRAGAYGDLHPDTLSSVLNKGANEQSQGQYLQAEQTYKRVLAAGQRALGEDHPVVQAAIGNLAWLYFSQGNWQGAIYHWRRRNSTIIRRIRQGTRDQVPILSGQARSASAHVGNEFWGLVKAESYAESQRHSPQMAGESFLAAQWALGSEAALSLSQMAARGAKDDAELSTLVRNRQDLASRWLALDGLRNRWLAQMPDKRNAKAEAETRAELSGIEAELSRLDRRLQAEFAGYAALAQAEPLSVEEVQSDLRPGEALILILDTPAAMPTPEESFIWVVTKTQMRWVRSDLGGEALAREVAALRCGLDETSWIAPRDEAGDSAAERARKAAQRAKAEACFSALGSAPEKQADGRLFLPFDHARAYKLYQALFGQIESFIENKQLLIVPSGPLTQLPFQVLVRQPPAAGAADPIRWLVRDHAITVLPAVSSLRALRRVAKPSKAIRRMIGFGNPLLSGRPDDPDRGARDRKRAELAQRYRTCPSPPRYGLAGIGGPADHAALPDREAGRVKPDSLRRLTPLPETADELCAVAWDIGANMDEIRLGARASEREVKRLSRSGALANYAIVHFATHGAVAGQLDGAAEPGLVLTPPDQASEEDDGYLSASEIAGLKLDADWVILSACNTAAGGAQNAEALSGLARVFFYAQARALLVSHWRINSAAAVKLVTATMKAVGKNQISRAEALRQAMLQLIDHGQNHETRPAYWAPFVLVGEGDAR